MLASRLLSRGIISILLGALTVLTISSAEKNLPYSSIREAIVGAASLPAIVIVRIWLPAGVHTGGGVAYWGLAFLFTDVCFYAMVWFVLLWFIARIRNRPKRVAQV